MARKTKAGIQKIKVFYLNQDTAGSLPDSLINNPEVELDTFHSGLDLYQYLKSGHRAQALVLDLKSQALSLIHLLQQDSVTRTPVILVADEVTPELFQKACNLGIDDVFTSANLNEHFLSRLHYLAKKYHLLNNRPAAPSLKQAIQLDLLRLANVLVAGIVLVLSLPLLAVVAAVSWFNFKEPVFLKTKQLGRGNKIYDLFTFRLPQVSESVLNNSTKIKNWLIKTRLYELPKLLNVVRGEVFLLPLRYQPLYQSARFTPEDYCLRFAAPTGPVWLDYLLAAGLNQNQDQTKKIAEEMQLNNFWHNLLMMLKNISGFYKRRVILNQNAPNGENQQVAYN